MSISRKRVALMGFGSVGQGLATILRDQPHSPISLTLVVDRGGYAISPDGLSPVELLDAKQQGSVASHSLGVAGPLTPDVLEASTADVLVEASSTNFEDAQPGWDYVNQAIDLELDVVLASKGPLVLYGAQLYAKAAERGVAVGISATHGAPLPAVDLARIALPGNQLLRIRALLNSTTGLILEAMERGASFDEAVKEAMTGGVMETNSALDIDGYDAAAKCVILTRAIFGINISLGDVTTRGIRELSTREVEEAASAGTPIKLVAEIEPSSSGIHARVEPRVLGREDPLSGLRRGALGIVYEAEPVGPLFLAGYGSGGMPTAAAVMRDILNLD